MARHDQKPRPQKAYICSRCKEIDCQNCIDVIRVRLFGKDAERVCSCEHKDLADSLIGLDNAENNP